MNNFLIKELEKQKDNLSEKAYNLLLYNMTQSKFSPNKIKEHFGWDWDTFDEVTWELERKNIIYWKKGKTSQLIIDFSGHARK